MLSKLKVAGIFTLSFLNALIGLGVIVWLVLFVSGEFYQSVRLVFEYEKKSAQITKCEPAIVSLAMQDGHARFASFKIQTVEFTTPIKLWSGVRKAHPSDYVPIDNWCEILNQKMEVLHYERFSSKVIFYDGNLISSIARSYSPLEQLLLFIYGTLGTLIVLAILWKGVIFFLAGTQRVFKTNLKVWNDTKATNIEKLNGAIFPTAILVLTSAFVISVGALLMRSIALFDFSSVYISGLVGLSGIHMIAIGPGLILNGIHFFKRSDHQFLVLFRNFFLLCTSALFFYRAFAFSVLHDGPTHNEALEYFIEAALSLLP